MKTKQTEKTKDDAKQIIVVPAAIKAAVQAYITLDQAANQAAEGARKGMLNCGQAMAKTFGDKETARPVLKQAFDDAGRDSSDITNASVISKILTLGFPENAKAAESLANALKAGLNTNKAIAAARGSLRVAKDGKETKVEKTGNQGGHNKKKPVETMDAQIALALTTCETSKLDAEQFAVALAKHLTDLNCFDLDDLIEALETEKEKD